MKKISQSVFFGVAICLACGATACGGNNAENSGSGGTGGGGNKIDTCSIITQQDATTLFGNPATPDTINTIVDPNFEGECKWNWGTDTDQQGLSFTVWHGKNYYSAPTDSTPYTIGDQGYVRSNSTTGVKVGWLQGDYTASVYYVTIGSNVPNATTQVAQVQALAQKASSALSSL
jgi:hypothetical protein